MSVQKPKALLIDMDGTVTTNGREVRIDVLKEILNERRSFDLPQRFFDECIGKSLVTNMKRLEAFLTEKGQSIPEDFTLEILRQEYSDGFEARLGELTIRPGMKELMSQAKDAGIKVIIVSNSKTQRILDTLAAHNMEHLIDDVVASDCKFLGNNNKKPNPASYLYAMELAQAEPEECVVLEDSREGVEAALRADIFAIQFKNPHEKNHPQAYIWRGQGGAISQNLMDKIVSGKIFTGPHRAWHQIRSGITIVARDYFGYDPMPRSWT